MAQKNHFYFSLVALITGCILPLAFAPFLLYPIAFISPTLILYTWMHSSSKQAFLQGLLFGIGFFAVGISWVSNSIYNFGTQNIFLTILITALLILALSLFPATQGYIFNKFFKNKPPWVSRLIAFPALWVVWEWLRTWLLTGFPWLLLGYSQTNSVLRGFAPIIGVYGISFIISLCCGAILLFTMSKSASGKILNSLLILIIVIVGIILKPILWTEPVGNTIHVSLIQGNISQQMKWNISNILNILELYKTTTEKYWQSKIIVWPEAAIPTTIQQTQSYLQQLNQSAKSHQSTILTGIINNPKPNIYYNSLIALGKGKGIYNKQHLVPFGEYTPLSSLINPIMNAFNIPMSDLSEGKQHQQPIKINNMKIATFICYEIAYPNEVLKATRGTSLIVVINDDSWFGDSIAAPQQIQMAEMRALETGRFVLYSSVTGITAIISPLGEIISKAPIDKFYVLSGKIKFMHGATPLMKSGYWPLIIFTILLLLFAFLYKRKKL